MRHVILKILGFLMVCSLQIFTVSSVAVSATHDQISLLKSNQSYRSNFSSQPNLEKGEITLPVQVSIIYIIKQSLPDFLFQAAARNKMELTLSDKVTGTLNKLSLPMNLELILAELAKSHGLEWHIYDNHLFISNSLENTNRQIALGNLNLLKLKEIINKAGLNPGANKMTYVESKNAITLIGSASYIARVETLINNYHRTSDSN